MFRLHPPPLEKGRNLPSLSGGKMVLTASWASLAQDKAHLLKPTTVWLCLLCATALIRGLLRLIPTHLPRRIVPTLPTTAHFLPALSLNEREVYRLWTQLSWSTWKEEQVSPQCYWTMSGVVSLSSPTKQARICCLFIQATLEWKSFAVSSAIYRAAIVVNAASSTWTE